MAATVLAAYPRLQIAAINMAGNPQEHSNKINAVEEARITKRQWRAFVAAWLGWAFDGLDGYLYVLVAITFVRQLLGPAASQNEVVQKASLVQGFFLIGWACGGIVFGRIGDRLGRARTLSLTILTYACFTGLTFFATAWWHLLILRFLAALGIGGEWAAGSALVSETWHAKHRAWASATLQSGYMVGMIMAAFTIRYIGADQPKYVFLVGVLPALATFWIRKAVGEPEVWQGEVKRKTVPSLLELFEPGVIGTTFMTLGLASIALTTVWAFLYFAPQAVRDLGTANRLGKPEVSELIFWFTLTYTFWNIAGNFFGTYLAKFTNFRFAFTMLMLFSFLSFYFGFRQARTLQDIGFWFNLCAFFSLGIFGLFPLYIPPLFPTLLRTTGAGFSYNTGRIISGIVLIILGVTAANINATNAIFWVSFLYIPGVLLAMFMPELPKHSAPAPEEAAAMV